MNKELMVSNINDRIYTFQDENNNSYELRILFYDNKIEIGNKIKLSEKLLSERQTYLKRFYGQS